MFTISDAFYLALFFTAMGTLIGIGIACWPRSRKSQSFDAYRAPYDVKKPDRVDVWARETGAI